jgi:hypothetical protein
MKTYGRVGAYIHVFLTSVLVGGVWVGYKVGLDDVEKILELTGTQTPTPRPSSP